MKLLDVTVRNYRIHKEVTVSFGDGVTVIAGPNESGKSTLVEAIHNALFLRSRATGEVAQSLRSAHHAGHPSVILGFTAGGKRWTIEKTFTGTSSGSTTLKEQGGRTRHNEEAEEEIHRLLQEEEVGGGRGIAERIRGRWAHLWVWQGTAGAPPGGQGPGEGSMEKLRERLGRLGSGSVLESATDGSVARQVLDLVAGSHTDKGRIKAGSELAWATEELEAARAGRAAAEAVLAALDEAVREVDAAERVLAEGTRSVAKIRGELVAAEQRREALTAVDLALGRERVAADSARRAHEELARADAEIRALDERIRAAEVVLSPAREELECAKAAEGAQRARLDAAVAGLGGLTARQREADARARLQALVEQAHRLVGRAHELHVALLWKDATLAPDDDRVARKAELGAQHRRCLPRRELDDVDGVVCKMHLLGAVRVEHCGGPGNAANARDTAARCERRVERSNGRTHRRVEAVPEGRHARHGREPAAREARRGAVAEDGVVLSVAHELRQAKEAAPATKDVARGAEQLLRHGRLEVLALDGAVPRLHDVFHEIRLEEDLVGDARLGQELAHDAGAGEEHGLVDP